MGKSFVDAIYSKLLTANEIFQPCPWCAARCCDGILISSGNRPGWNPHRKVNYTMNDQNKEDRLVKLPNGSWVRPSSITAIRPLRTEKSVVGNLHRARVVVHLGDITEVILADDYEHAQQIADEIAKLTTP